MSLALLNFKQGLMVSLKFAKIGLELLILPSPPEWWNKVSYPRKHPKTIVPPVFWSLYFL